jgi:RNA polymerase sigma-19 factor, ECF subfamily
MSADRKVKHAAEATQTVGEMCANLGERLRRFIAGRTRASHSANDLAQEVYLRLLRFPSREVIENPAAYMYRVAAHVVQDFNLRQENERVRFDSQALQALADHTADIWIDDLTARLDAEQEVERLLQRLPPALRIVLILCKRDGQSYEEAGAKLGISPNTVKKHLADAIALCRVWAARNG